MSRVNVQNAADMTARIRMSAICTRISISAHKNSYVDFLIPAISQSLLIRPTQ